MRGLWRPDDPKRSRPTLYVLMAARLRKTGMHNAREIKSAEIEGCVLAAIKNRLLALECVALIVEEAKLAAENDARRITQA